MLNTDSFMTQDALPISEFEQNPKGFLDKFSIEEKKGRKYVTKPSPLKKAFGATTTLSSPHITADDIPSKVHPKARREILFGFDPRQRKPQNCNDNLYSKAARLWLITARQVLEESGNYEKDKLDELFADPEAGAIVIQLVLNELTKESRFSK